ncbi:MAG TPA: ATP-binding protein [Verrucomicrobiae bacterium]|nr:ATP-binding protein [Verrucomicrobiae bacterium]
MGKLKRAILLNFRTKVIVPVVAVMVLLMATSMWLINGRVTHQLQAQAAEQLATADAVLGHAQKLRMGSLLASYRKVESEPMFKAHAALFDPSQGGFSETAQKTVRGFLDKMIEEKFAKVIMVAPAEGSPLCAADDAWVKIDEFEGSCRGLAASAMANGPIAGVVRNGDQLLDVVAVPLRLRDEVVAAFVFGVENTLRDDIRELARGEALLLLDNQPIVSTVRERQLESLLVNQIAAAGHSTRGKIDKLILNGEHFLCLNGTLQSARSAGQLGYIILSSYEKPLQVLRETKQLILLVSIVAIVVGITIVWLYVRRVTEPLEDLREHTEAIGKGDFTRRVELDSRDEFGDLAEAFNHMTENLKLSRQQLEATVETLKTTQAQLIQSEKLSGIGEFVAGVAHELNNPLTSVMGFSELLQLGDTNPEQKRHLEMVHKSALRCQKIVQSLLSFSRHHQPERKLVCVNKLVEAVVEILAYQMRTSNIEVITQLDPKLPQAMVDQHQIQQVVLNIVNNARQAIEEHRPKGCVRISSGVAGRNVRITIQDDGPGIREENLSRLFDPFFTTKEVGKGTGLGLSLCYGIVKEHGGTIHVRSKYGEGATFFIELPIATDTEHKAKSMTGNTVFTSRNQLSGNGRNVLVIDDEEPILQMVSEVLSRSGYQVDVASDGESALKRLNNRRYDLTICDWKMPGLNGREVYERIRTTDLGVSERFIFMTGDVINDRIQEFLKQENKFCLSKPFSITEFEHAIQQALPKN